MILAAAICGWLLAWLLAARILRLRRRLELVAEADHELRGPVTVLSLGLDSLAAEPSVGDRAGVLRGALERLRAGLDDLATARVGRRRAATPERLGLEGLVSDCAAGWTAPARRLGRKVVVDWRAGPISVVADRGRLSQLFGNLVSNALEHGTGEVELRAERRNGAVRVEVCDRGGTPVSVPVRPASNAQARGLGLPIAARAAAQAGGNLSVKRDDTGTRVIVELPVADP